MKTKIVYYSYSGNTKSVSERLHKELEKQGIKVAIEAIHAKDENPNSKTKELTEVPEVTDFDLLIFATPVYAFSIAPIMKMYLEQLPDLTNKKTISFVTHHFPLSWLGGKQTNNRISKIIRHKNASVLDTYVIDWSNKKREDQIKLLITSIKNLIENNTQ